MDEKPPRVKITPTCRYGHGDLVRVPGSFQIHGVNAMLAPTGGLLGRPHVIARPNQSTLTINTFWCSTCGYTELQDWTPEAEE